MKARAAASSRVFSALRTAPVIGTPKCASIICGVLDSITATVSPGPIPRLTRAEASRLDRSATSRHVSRHDPWITATRSGYTSAVRARNETGVRGT